MRLLVPRTPLDRVAVATGVVPDDAVLATEVALFVAALLRTAVFVRVGVDVSVGVEVAAVPVDVDVVVAVEVLVAVAVVVLVAVGVFVAVFVAVGVFVAVFVAVAVPVAVFVGVAVSVAVFVGVAVSVAVLVGVGVLVAVCVAVGVNVGVAVGGVSTQNEPLDFVLGMPSLFTSTNSPTLSSSALHWPAVPTAVNVIEQSGTLPARPLASKPPQRTLFDANAALQKKPAAAVQDGEPAIAGLYFTSSVNAPRPGAGTLLASTETAADWLDCTEADPTLITVLVTAAADRPSQAMPASTSAPASTPPMASATPGVRLIRPNGFPNMCPPIAPRASLPSEASLPVRGGCPVRRPPVQ